MKGAFEKLRKSLQIKGALYTDPEHPELEKTVSQMNELASKIGFEPIKPLIERRTRHASAGATLMKKNTGVGITATAHGEANDAESDANPLAAILGMVGQSISVSDEGAASARENPFETLLSDRSSSILKQREEEHQFASDLEARLEARNDQTVMENLMRKFFKPDGKIITEEDSEDVGDEIDKQVERHQISGVSKGEDEEQEDEDSESDDEKLMLKDDQEINGKLNANQKGYLSKLKDDIYQKGSLMKKYNPLPDIVNSSFFNSLSPKSRDRFRLVNIHIFEPN